MRADGMEGEVGLGEVGARAERQTHRQQQSSRALVHHVCVATLLRTGGRDVCVRSLLR